MKPRQDGFSLVAAIFLVVVLAGLGAVAVRISVAQSSSASSALRGVQALHAAKSGVAWASHRALAGNCGNQTATLTEGGVNNFSVTTRCNQTTHTEGAATTNVFIIDVLAASGNYGTSDYVSRRVQVKITDST